ncbi:MAG: succinate dehydrogenase/fumarate reductase iron-sulfur subunit [Lentimicrobiaceae bacterium]|nr:succinate dehydrogenase/fumarate reductase iron-sulfur subunit [Lentimicrobiaceae bacterium]
MKVRLKIWRQPNAQAKGKFITYTMDTVSPEMSFLEMLDALNSTLVEKGEMPVAFEHDCREGICGSCGLYINGHPHGPQKLVTTCHLYMREFHDGQTIVVEPWRARPFPVIRDLIVDRTALEKILVAGGYISVDTGQATDANTVRIQKEKADESYDSAVCIGCGACVAACKNASAMLFVSAKVSQFALLPQGQVEAKRRVERMVATMDELGFGNCTNTYACEAECPKGIKITNIARMNREFWKAKVCGQKVQ